MASDHILSQISHYQKKLEKYASVGEDEKLLYCIHKLKYLPVTVNHLEVTGVGKSINSLRHRHGTIGEKSRALVQKWKLMVAAEEQEEQQNEKEEEPSAQKSSSTKNAQIKAASSNVVSSTVESDNYDEEYDASDEGDRLQIEECESVDKSYNPGGNKLPDNEEDNCNGYNPKTSREDYLSAGVEPPSSSYYPSVDVESPSDAYVPAATNDDDCHVENSAPSASHSMINGNDHSQKDKTKALEDDGKRKHHKSKHKHGEKHHNASSSSSGSSNKEKSKDKSPSRKKHSKDKHRHKESHKQRHRGNSDTDRKHTSSRHEDIKSSNHSGHKSSLHTDNGHSNHSSSSPSKSKKSNCLENPVEAAKYSPLYEKMIESNNNKFKESFPPTKPSKNTSKDEQKSKKRKTEEVAQESSSGFEAALMGMDSLTKKKKKKKSKDMDIDLLEPEELIDIDLSDKPKLLNANYGKSLPQLPSSFDGDEPMATQLMTHYKPLPYVPQRSVSKDPFTLQMTDEEALNYMLSSKQSNKQRKVYAGKATRLTEVPSLFEHCIRVLQENIDALEATGGIPFDILRPVLERASPQQLFILEDFNPYLLDNTDILWNSHCRKAFKNKGRDDMETWREMYIRCTDENKEKMRSLTENLQKKYVTKATPIRTTQLAFINTVAKPPKSVARAQARYGTASTSAPSHARPSKTEDASSTQKAGGAPAIAPKSNRPFSQPRPTAVKKPKLAPLMAKSRLLHKKVCRR